MARIRPSRANPVKTSSERNTSSGGNALPVERKAPVITEAEFEENIPRNEYIEMRKMYIEGEQQGYQSFDNALLTLSSAILGLSVTFTQAFIPNPQNKEILFMSWICLIATLLLTLFSQISSQAAFRHQIRNLDRIYKGDKEKANIWDGVTATLNMFCAATFAVGIIMLVVFGYFNLR